MALGVIRAASERNVSIPNDLALVGFDDIQLSSYVTPALSTVAQPINEIGKIAIDLIVEKDNTQSLMNQKIILPVNLIVRQSCGGLLKNNYLIKP
jgi:LacI family transcriptional regulator